MKRIGWRFVLLVVVCVAQLVVPAVMLARHEGVLARGEVYRFRCAPVDPVDLFRGRYVALGYSADSVTFPEDFTFSRGEKVYVRVEEGADGFATLSAPSRTPHEEGAYLRVRVLGWPGHDPVSVQLPFDRYYLEEGLAPEAERAYLEGVRRDDAEAWVTVRILDGRGVLEELYLDGVPIRDYLGR